VSKGTQIAIGALLVAALVGWYGWTSLGSSDAYRYYASLDEFQAAGAAGSARVHGYVAEGSIERDLETKTVRFVVQQDPPHAGASDSSPTLSVHYGSLETPDLFKHGAEVVVEGELSADGEPVFQASKVFAKCPSKFQAQATEQASF
jgi:cytochrome c-type biogenesis protein CcmE